jgi:hypothetical protein
MGREGTGKSLYERWQKKLVIPEDPNACWGWIGGTFRRGYGAIGSGPPEWKNLRAHRVSYEFHNGPIPDGYLVRHKCDNPKCGNPLHLELGTVQDNTDDKMERGRFRPSKGSKNGMSKLSEKQVNEIRQLLAAGERQHVIAAKYGVARTLISRIKTGAR